MNTLNESGIEKCIKEAGGQTELAEKIEKLTGQPVKQQHVSYWKGIGYVPELYREAVLLAVNNFIPESDLKKKSILLKTA